MKLMISVFSRICPKAPLWKIILKYFSPANSQGPLALKSKNAKRMLMMGHTRKIQK